LNHSGRKAIKSLTSIREIANRQSATENHLPPPAQAQAQPAQAQAQAQLRPPPPPLRKPPPLRVLLVFGMGLVRLVTPLVKDCTLPSTRLEKFCTPVTTEAANAEPGMLVGAPRPVDTDGAAVPAPVRTVPTGR
jgi:hypothetical protein